jgi:hypothetical protein
VLVQVSHLSALSCPYMQAGLEGAPASGASEGGSAAGEPSSGDGSSTAQQQQQRHISPREARLTEGLPAEVRNKVSLHIELARPCKAGHV